MEDDANSASPYLSHGNMSRVGSGLGELCGSQSFAFLALGITPHCVHSVSPEPNTVVVVDPAGDPRSKKARLLRSPIAPSHRSGHNAKMKMLLVNEDLNSKALDIRGSTRVWRGNFAIAKFSPLH